MGGDALLDKKMRVQVLNQTRETIRNRDHMMKGMEELALKSEEHAERKRLAAEAEQERLAAEKRERERMLAEDPALAAELAERERLAAEQARETAEQADFAQLLQDNNPEDQAAMIAAFLQTDAAD